MKEKEFQTLAQQLLDGDLPTETVNRFEMALADNDQQRKDWERLESVHTKLSAPPMAEAPALFAANVMAAIQAQESPAQALSRRFNRILPMIVVGVSTAAALPIMVSLVLLVAISQQPVLAEIATNLFGDGFLVLQSVLNSIFNMGVAFVGWLAPQPGFMLAVGLAPVLAVAWLRTMRHFTPNQLSA